MSDIIEIILAALGVFLLGFCLGDSCGWSKAERWFWATRDKK